MDDKITIIQSQNFPTALVDGKRTIPFNPGGDCYFHFSFDVKKSEIRNLRINGNP